MNMRVPLIALAMLVLAGPALARGDDGVGFQMRTLSIPMTDANGGKHQLYGVLCIPTDADGPVRLAVLNHGSPAKASDRPTQEIGSCNSEPAQWMLSEGFAVLYAQRRGYGKTGGDRAEGYGSCSNPDFVRAGRETARDIAAIVDFGLKQQGIRPDGAIVAGMSAGGWGTIAYNAQPHPKVAAIINVSGGRGGHQGEDGSENCGINALVAAAGTFGKTAATPMFWVYAQNDSFFDPDTAKAMYQAYSRAGGKAEFHPVGAYDDEGHDLWAGEGGSEIWGPLVEAYLKKRGVL